MGDGAAARAAPVAIVSAIARSALLKRVIDIVVASLALVVTAPIMLAIAILVRLTMGSPVLFVQSRPGRDGRLFRLLKFRTMMPRDGADAVDDADRVTSLGRVLRSTSLDELPELINVLRGDMSLVGPRPLLTSYLELYTPEQFRRHQVRPGVTGLAQTVGRKGLSWERTFELDVWYVDHWSLWLDLRILLRTILTVIGHVGRTAGDDHRRPDFAGTSDADAPASSSLGGRGGPPDPVRSDRLPILTPEEMADWIDRRGGRVVEHRGHYWARNNGFYQPVHLLEELSAPEATRPTALCLGFRAVLRPQDVHHANGSIPVRLMRGLDGFEERWSSNRRNQLRRCRKRVDIRPLVDPWILMEQGWEVVASAAERIGFEAPSLSRYQADLDTYIERSCPLILAGFTDEELCGYLTGYAVGTTAYVDRFYVHTDHLSTYASIGLLYDFVRICSASPGVSQVVHGIERRENPSLGSFKDSLGFPVFHAPTRFQLPPGADPILRRWRPDAYHRLTGRTASPSGQDP